MEFDLTQFFVSYQDSLASRLDVYEQALYLYIVRHSRLAGHESVVVGFKTARKRIALGVGQSGTPMSEGTVSEKLQSLEAKGFIKVLTTTHKGRLIRAFLPEEILGSSVDQLSGSSESVEDLDFFNNPENRRLLLEREGHRCFYTLEGLNEDNFVVEHVQSRPLGTNSYRNCVAASRRANNMKGAMAADDFFRKLFREGYLSQSEFEDRLRALSELLNGELIPKMD